MTHNGRWGRWAAGAACLALAVGVLSAQRGRGAGAPDPALQDVRVAIGRGQIADARRLAGAIAEAPTRDLAQALVDVFEGNDEAARGRLVPLADASPRGDAALELGLLELRRGERAAGWKRLDLIAANRAFAGPEDYFRLARAARGAREYLLANDAYQRIADESRADVQTEWGDLFLQRHLPGDAVINYRRALEIDPGWIPALLGLARAIGPENPKVAEAAFEEARKRAPDHPDLWLLVAERELERENPDAAAAALDRVAAARPGSADEAAWRAAVAYAREETPAMDAAIARLRAIDALSALGYRRVGQQAARDYRFDDAARFARQATEIDREDPYAHFDLGNYLMRTGDEAGARVALERSWDLDKSAPLTKNLLEVLDKVDTFETVTYGNFIFKFAPEEAAVLRAYAIPLAEEAQKTFTARYGFTPDGPILIELFPIHDDFAVRTIGLQGLVGALGACFGRVIVMDSPRAQQPGTFSWQATLWHEIAHVYTLQLSKYRVPRWLTEGVSVYEEHRRVPAWGRELELQFAAQFGRGRSFGVKNLPQAFKQPETLALAYFEASLLVEHLVAQNGDAGLRALLVAYGDGATDAEAFSRAFGRGVDAVETTFRAFVEDRYGALARAMEEPPAMSGEAGLDELGARALKLPGNFQAQMAYGVALARSGDRAGARPVLERAAALAPAASGPGSPRAILAQLAEEQGDLPRARRELRELLKFDHTNVMAARKLAALAGDDESAAADRESALRLVADLDPFDASVHVQLGRRLMTAGRAAPALVEFQAALALGPPNVAEARTDYAEALHTLGRSAEARRQVLLALQAAPSYPRAQDLLLAIIGREDE